MATEATKMTISKKTTLDFAQHKKMKFPYLSHLTNKRSKRLQDIICNTPNQSRTNTQKKKRVLINYGGNKIELIRILTHPICHGLCVAGASWSCAVWSHWPEVDLQPMLFKVSRNRKGYHSGPLFYRQGVPGPVNVF